MDDMLEEDCESALASSIVPVAAASSAKASAMHQGGDTGRGSGAGAGVGVGAGEEEHAASDVCMVEFERQLLEQPNASAIWLPYMALLIERGHLEGARALAERALQTIHRYTLDL